MSKLLFGQAFKALGERAHTNNDGLRQMHGLSLPEGLDDGEAKFKISAVEIPSIAKQTERAEVTFTEKMPSRHMLGREYYAIYHRVCTNTKRGLTTLQPELFERNPINNALTPIHLGKKKSALKATGFNKRELERMIADGRSAVQYLDEEA